MGALVHLAGLGWSQRLGRAAPQDKKRKKISPFIFSRGLIFRPREFLIFGANSWGARGGALPLKTKKEKKIFGPFIFSLGFFFGPWEFLIFGAN